MVLMHNDEMISGLVPKQDSVSVTASSDTRGTLLTKLYNAIDKTKVTGASYIVYGNYIYLPERVVENGSIVFNMLDNPSSTKLRWSKINLTTPYFYEFSVENGVTLADKTSDSVTDGTPITLYY